MKTYHFKVEYLVTRECTIEAETAREAKEAWDANEWTEGQDIDCVLQDADQPNWDEPDSDDDAEVEDDDLPPMVEDE